ncbi:hypothetical protein [Bacillus sp. FJAT-18017]|uniref:hypothetical protein n=1 Tax=Bacillus sp. FJAT-18017 TaxID=1705566 RepID=UPI000A400DA0|nr:hypothetical protein [Bacillus sp. FJAT-18017]
MKNSGVAEGQMLFFEILKRAYEKGLTETEMTTWKMLEDLKLDLQSMPIAESDRL